MRKFIANCIEGNRKFEKEFNKIFLQNKTLLLGLLVISIFINWHMKLLILHIIYFYGGSYLVFSVVYYIKKKRKSNKQGRYSIIFVICFVLSSPFFKFYYISAIYHFLGVDIFNGLEKLEYIEVNTENFINLENEVIGIKFSLPNDCSTEVADNDYVQKYNCGEDKQILFSGYSNKEAPDWIGESPEFMDGLSHTELDLLIYDATVFDFKLPASDPSNIDTLLFITVKQFYDFPIVNVYEDEDYKIVTFKYSFYTYLHKDSLKTLLVITYGFQDANIIYSILDSIELVEVD